MDSRLAYSLGFCKGIAQREPLTDKEVIEWAYDMETAIGMLTETISVMKAEKVKEEENA